MTGRRGRRRKQLLDDIKEKTRYWKLKEEALDRTLGRTRLGRGYGPVVRRTTEWMNDVIKSVDAIGRVRICNTKSRVSKRTHPEETLKWFKLSRGSKEEQEGNVRITYHWGASWSLHLRHFLRSYHYLHLEGSHLCCCSQMQICYTGCLVYLAHIACYFLSATLSHRTWLPQRVPYRPRCSRPHTRSASGDAQFHLSRYMHEVTD
jgi:hypothetical protein